MSADLKFVDVVVLEHFAFQASRGQLHNCGGGFHDCVILDTCAVMGVFGWQEQ